MKLPIISSFSQQQQKTLFKVVMISFSCSLMLVAGVWGVRAFEAKRTKKLHEAASSPQAQELAKYQAGAEVLLDIDVAAHRLAARHYIETDQPGDAVAHLLRLHARFRFDRQIALELGTAYLEAGQPAKALNILKKLVDENIEDSLVPRIGARYGRALFYAGKTSQSLEILNKLREDFPAFPEILCYLGEVEMARESPSPRAEEYLRNAIALDPLYIDGRYQQARYLMNTGRYTESRDSLLIILKLAPLHVRAHSRLGMIYYYLGQFDMALKAYQTALALNPNDYNTHYNLGELFLSAYDDPQKALTEFKETIALMPTHAEANFKIGLICLGNNMFKEAALYLTKACHEQPRNTRFLLQLAVAFEKLDLKNDALAAYRSIAEIDPLNEIARQKIALIRGSMD